MPDEVRIPMRSDALQVKSPMARGKKIIKGMAVSKSPKWGKAKAKKKRDTTLPISLK